MTDSEIEQIEQQDMQEKCEQLVAELAQHLRGDDES